MPQPRPMHRWLALPYTVWAVIAFTLIALAVLLLILLVPSQEARRRMVRAAARSALLAAGMRVVMVNAQHLPANPCVVVANHASYLDGIVLHASLPPMFGFVIKREMSRVPLANLLLKRIGAHYVERSASQKGARDTRRLLRKAAAGSALVFFPEGTFGRQPGLLRFRNGAFAVAAKSGMGVLPIAIRGTRTALPGGTLLLRPARIEIELTPLLPPPASTAAVDIAVTLASARQAILMRIGEPDLALDS